jgi:hypothetical protein
MTICYLCNQELRGDVSPDHIIPDELFVKGDPHRPKLSVHQKCNNLKSKEDEWFVKQLQLRCSFNPEAKFEFSKLIHKAKNEQPDAYLIGKKLHNLKLATGIFKNITWGWELKHGEQNLMQMQISEKDSLRFRKYLDTMCRGLFIINVKGSNPGTPELFQSQYAYAELKRKDEPFVNTVRSLIESSKSSVFGQWWNKRISYVGSRVKESPNNGFVFIQFYLQFGVLAFFK